jgi:3-oxoacyl-[acyl-carrier protein] reductase
VSVFEAQLIPGRTALVTAASEGIGYACARALAGAGADVVLVSRDAERIAAAATRIREETGRRTHALAADLSEQGAGARIVHEATKALGAVEILVANVGGPPPGRFEDLDAGAWDRALTGVLRPALDLSRAVLPAMRIGRFGRLVHVLSITTRVPVEGLTASNVVRPAVAGLVADLARENAVHGITVNGVSPGYTRTRRLEELGASSPEKLREIERGIPASRLADASEIAAPVVFLASDGASYINGQTIAVDGGLTARPC